MKPHDDHKNMTFLKDRKSFLEKRAFTLRERLGVKTALKHGQKVPKEIWQSPYYNELLEIKKELGQINKKMYGRGQKHSESLPVRFMKLTEQRHPQIFGDILKELKGEEFEQ